MKPARIGTPPTAALNINLLLPVAMFPCVRAYRLQLVFIFRFFFIFFFAKDVPILQRTRNEVVTSTI